MIQADLLMTAASESLNETAKSLARSAEREVHWSRFAIILGRVQDDELWQTFGYGSTRAYAEFVLRIPGDEFFGLRGLWQVMKNGRDTVALDEWATVPKTYALQIKRAVTAKLRDDVRPRPLREWIEIAKRLVKDETADSMRREVDRYLEKEEWVNFSLRLPALAYDMLIEAMRRKLPTIAGELSPDPELVNDRKYRFQCFEAVVADSLAGISLPDPVCAACGASIDVVNDGLTLRVRRHECERGR